MKKIIVVLGILGILLVGSVGVLADPYVVPPASSMMIQISH